jgi:hypothetical protein
MRRASVPAKKTRKSADKARYLLSADRKFRRLSLKKISERVKNARPRTRARSSAKAVTAPEPAMPAAHKSAPENAPVALVLGGAVAFAVIVGVLWSSPAPVAATDNTAVLTADVASVPSVSAKLPVVSPEATAPPSVTAPPAANASPAPAAVIVKATSTPSETVKPRTEIVPLPVPVARSSAPVVIQPDVAAASVDTVTITGCLDHDGKSAWLKDTSGVDAPKSRSWKSGFLKKRTPRIALVDGPTSASAWDGRRVSVTGLLVDREMRVNSMNPIEGNCE